MRIGTQPRRALAALVPAGYAFGAGAIAVSVAESKRPTEARVRQNVRRLKRRTLFGLQRSLHYSGAAEVHRRRESSAGFIALMYHSVADPLSMPFIDPAGTLLPSVFDKQLSLLKQHCSVVSLNDAVAWMGGHHELPPRAVVLTFDDGYLDNLQVAAPLLRKHGLPATVFPATGYVDRREPQWIDELHCAFRYRRRDLLTLGSGEEFNLASERVERQAYSLLTRLLLASDMAGRRQLFDQVTSCLDPVFSIPELTLTWENLRTLRRDYPEIEIGIHGHDHLDLEALPLDEALAEVDRAQSHFESQLGYRARFMSYPYGRTSLQLAARLAECGIQAAFTTQPTNRITPDCDLMAMPRYAVTSSLTDFRLWSEGVLPDLGRRLFGQVADHA